MGKVYLVTVDGVEVEVPVTAGVAAGRHNEKNVPIEHIAREIKKNDEIEAEANTNNNPFVN